MKASFDWTINIGHIVILIGMAWGIITGWFGLRMFVNTLNTKLEVFGGRLINVEQDLREINKVLTAVAVQDARMDNMEERYTQLLKVTEEHRTWTRQNVTDILNKFLERQQNGRRG